MGFVLQKSRCKTFYGGAKANEKMCTIQRGYRSTIADSMRSLDELIFDEKEL